MYEFTLAHERMLLVKFIWYFMVLAPGGLVGRLSFPLAGSHDLVAVCGPGRHERRPSVGVWMALLSPDSGAR